MHGRVQVLWSIGLLIVVAKASSLPGSAYRSEMLSKRHKHRLTADRLNRRGPLNHLNRAGLTMRISLLHATYRAGAQALGVREEWLGRADQPALVEHLFACNADDLISLASPEIASGVVSVAAPGRVTAVRNWNAAAASSSGALLVVIADDLFPPVSWDSQLRRLIVDLDPLCAAFAINVRDSDDSRDGLLRHPIISRGHYEKYGLFHPSYEGIGVDNDFTLSAFRRGLVIDGRELVLEHRHPSRGADASESHLAMSEASRCASGKALFDARWPRWKRHLWRRYLRPKSGQRRIGPAHRLWHGGLSRLGYLAGLAPVRARRTVRRVAGR